MQFLLRRRRVIAVVIVGSMMTGGLAVVLNHWLVGRYGRYIEAQQQLPDEPLVGVVFGGGIRGGRPTPLIADRLNAGAELLKAGKVRKLIVSGDNRFHSYDEPAAMREYLVEQRGVDPALIQEDKAGRSTYETCERARKVFGLDRAVLISESGHLPRAIYTCRKFGIEAYGYSSDGPALARHPEVRRVQRVREVLARAKATFNIYVRGERTILGDPIKV